MTPFSLSDADYAEMFIARYAPSPGTDVLDLEGPIVDWLRSARMDHVVSRSFSIAVQVSQQLAKAAPAPAPETVQLPARTEPVSRGQELSAEQIAGLDMAQYGVLRQRLGVGAGHSYDATMDFLGGR